MWGPGHKWSRTHIWQSVSPQFINPLTNIGEYLDCLHFFFLAAVKAGAVNIHTQVFVWIKVFIFHR